MMDSELIYVYAGKWIDTEWKLIKNVCDNKWCTIRIWL